MRINVSSDEEIKLYYNGNSSGKSGPYSPISLENNFSIDPKSPNTIHKQ